MRQSHCRQLRSLIPVAPSIFSGKPYSRRINRLILYSCWTAVKGGDKFHSPGKRRCRAESCFHRSWAYFDFPRLSSRSRHHGKHDINRQNGPC
jgi:hypothetical protein